METLFLGRQDAMQVRPCISSCPCPSPALVLRTRLLASVSWASTSSLLHLLGCQEGGVERRRRVGSYVPCIAKATVWAVRELACLLMWSRAWSNKAKWNPALPLTLSGSQRFPPDSLLCAMQRQTLVPVAEHMRTRGALGAAKIIDVAAGTGRFATFIKVRPPC